MFDGCVKMYVCPVLGMNFVHAAELLKFIAGHRILDSYVLKLNRFQFEGLCISHSSFDICCYSKDVRKRRKCILSVLVECLGFLVIKNETYPKIYFCCYWYGSVFSSKL